jgi:hypothetical protein
MIKSSDDLYTYHDRLVIPRPAHDLCILLLIKHEDNASRPNRRRLLSILLKRLWWGRMSFDYKARCSNCIACNRAKPSRQGFNPCLPWVFLITLAELSAWVFLRTYPKVPN